MSIKKIDCDVVVVGGGGAGLAAAIEASELGASVVLVEKNSTLGGSTAWSIGSVTSTRTPHQKKKGIIDSPEDHWADMPGFAGDLDTRDNAKLRRILCEEIPGTFQWLLDSGVHFMGPMPEPPHRQPRMHNVLPNSRSFIFHLGRRARRSGVEIKTGLLVTELIQKGKSVIGVLAEGIDGTFSISAKSGVILTAGDFTNNTEYKTRFMGTQEAKVEGVNLTATGDGQRMAETLGAQIVNGDLALGPEIRFIAPQQENWIRQLPPWRWLAVFMEWSMEHLPPSILRPFMMKFLTTALAPSTTLFQQGAILVNKRGERFVNELDRPALSLPDQEEKIGYILIDAALAKQFSTWPNYISTAPGIAYAYIQDYKINRPDVYTQASSLKELALLLNMDSNALELSGKQGLIRPLGDGPYICLGPVRSVFVHSEGGLAVDTRHRVLNTLGSPIEGLYAAGSTGQGGLLLKGHGHHLAWAFVSGRRAGRFAVQPHP